MILAGCASFVGFLYSPLREKCIQWNRYTYRDQCENPPKPAHPARNDSNAALTATLPLHPSRRWHTLRGMARRSTPRERRKVLEALEVPEVYHPHPDTPEGAGGASEGRKKGGAKIGRPLTKPDPSDPVAFALMAQRLTAGMGMREACSNPRCPAADTVYYRMANDPAFATAIARAREAQQHAIIDETVALADSATTENWQVVRLQIWARQWRAAKLAPKTYGEKVDVNHGGSVDIGKLTEDALSARIAELAGKAGIADAAGGEASPSVPPRPDRMVH